MRLFWMMARIRTQWPVLAFLALGVGLGCGGSDGPAANPGFTLDAGTNTGGRVISSADGGTDTGTTSASISGLARCTQEDEANCCYSGGLTGVPRCSWKVLARAETDTFMDVYRDSTMAVEALPAQVTLTNVSPQKITSEAACTSTAVGMVLEGHDVLEHTYVWSVATIYAVTLEGKWKKVGPAQDRLLVTHNSNPEFQPGSIKRWPEAPMPAIACYNLGDAKMNQKLAIHVERFRFEMSGNTYTFNADAPANGPGYFFYVERGW